jgi:thioredoxin 1
LVHEITDKEFEQKLIREEQPALVDMWAPWCTPCKALSPTLERLSEKYTGKLKFYKLNVDTNSRTPGKYRVMSVPTILLMKEGKVVDTIVGLVTERVLIARLDRLV